MGIARAQAAWLSRFPDRRRVVAGARRVYRAGIVPTALPLTPGRKLNIRVCEDGGGVYFRCPTLRCEGRFADWEYPQLHL